MKPFVLPLIALTLLAACQTTPVQPSPQPSGSPSTTPPPGATSASVPTAAGLARVVLPADMLNALGTSSATGQTRDLNTTVRFEIRSLNPNAERGEALAQWRFSAAALRARTSPLELDAGFLAPGDTFGFAIDYVNERMDCQRQVASDPRSVYSGVAIQPGERDNFSSTSADTLNLSYSDYPALSFPLPAHGEVRLPDGKPASGVTVEIVSQQSGEVIEAKTNADGYYVAPLMNQVFGAQVQIRVKALSDQAVFRTYQSSVTLPLSAAYECDESLGRHDISLAAR